MGGNIWENAIRLEAKEYHEFSKKIKEWYAPFTAYLDFDVIPAYRKKESFGDMDIVVSGSKEEWKKFNQFLVTENFPLSKNGDTVSIAWAQPDSKIFQIDLIFVGESRHDHNLAMDYYSWNDVGNFVGKLANFVGFKYGHDGFYYRHKDGAVAVHLPVDMGTSVIHHMLGLDHEKFKSGFDTLEDAFAWVAQSPFFDPRLFHLENVNSNNRRRDKKRDTYSKFLKWNEENHKDTVGVYYDCKEEYREYFFHVIDNYTVGALTSQISSLNYSVAVKNLRSLFYNGNIVSQETGLQGKELGKFIMQLGANFSLSDHAIISNPQKVKGIIREEYEKWKQTN